MIGCRGLKYECGKKLVIREAWFGAKIALVKEVCENAEPSRSSESALEIHRPVQFRGTGFGASVAPTDGTLGHSFVPEVASTNGNKELSFTAAVNSTDRSSGRDA